MKKFPQPMGALAGSRSRRRAVSGPALVVLTLTLAAIWFGSQTLNQTATESFDVKPSPQSTDQPAVLQDSAQPTALTSLSATPASGSSSSTAAPSSNSLGLPAGFPSSIPLPNNATLIKATVAGDEGDKNYIAAYQITSKPAEVSASYQQQLKEAGFEVHAVLGSADSGFFGAQKDALSITVSVGTDQQAPDKTNLTLTTSGQ